MLKEQVIAISGASGLMGRAFAHGVVKNGGKVILGDINDTGSLVDEFGNENAFFADLDVTNIDSINDFFEIGRQKFGKIDGVVHSAYPRSSQWGTRFEDLKPEGLAEDLFGQLGGAILFSQSAVSMFKEQGYGNLIHLSSIQGVSSPKFHHYNGTKMVSPIEYSAIKSGIVSITKYLAKYCSGSNIRVNCISPGGILDNQPEVFLQKYNDSCLGKGMLDAEDVVGTLIYLLSEQSKYVNGQNIIVDDGWLL
ncbi:oxidoreductase [Candidatus Thioglobus autotrophicus]|uniref:oxidoreductase n=1 Tax=Candidatus Thioglobus autotrophicus TaxID=1705394 RepID=UPI00299DADAC|nr:oxidoreductase [Candidatus Thioglobus autotrophicus]WPE17744.1 oxidoreductase [Candidatus Thioglobus autotrophicus]